MAQIVKADFWQTVFFKDSPKTVCNQPRLDEVPQIVHTNIIQIFLVVGTPCIFPDWPLPAEARLQWPE